MEFRLDENRFVSLKGITDSYYKLLKGNWECLILITRKGYWAYKTLVEKDASEGKKICTDRYVSKCLNMDEFKGKEIWIYDDTMNNGTNLFFYYCYFRKKGMKVTPVVYALNTEFPSAESDIIFIREYGRVCRGENISQEQKAEKAKKMIKEFKNDLKWSVRLTPEDIARVSAIEMKVFQERLCPLVIDLPILSCRKKLDGEYSTPAYMKSDMAVGIEMDQYEFDRLKKGNSKWIFVDNIFVQQHMNISGSYFSIDQKDVFGENLHFIHDLIVKCKYKESGDKVQLVFVPFAIFKSMTFRDVVRCFFSLLSDTAYGKEVYNYILHELEKQGYGDVADDVSILNATELADYIEVMDVMKFNHNLCRNMFRSIIFYASDCIGQHFKSFIYEEVQVELEYDFNFMEESFSKSFIDTFRKNQLDKNEYKIRFQHMSAVEAISPVNEKEPEKNDKKIAEKADIDGHILGRLIDIKNMVDDDLIKRIYTFETIESELDQRYIFNSNENRKLLITRTITEMLESSRFGNEIFVDNESQIIYRGFRYGENSELLLLPNMEYFYAYVNAFYFYTGEKLYKEKYRDFIEKLEAHFRRNKYFGNLISYNDFDFMKKYFGNIKEEKLEEQITNKRLVLDDYWHPKRNAGLKSFVDHAFELVYQWSF